MHAILGEKENQNGINLNCWNKKNYYNYKQI